MRQEIFNLLKKYSDDTFKVNSIIVSAFLKRNRITGVKNKEIHKHIISGESDDQKLLDNFLDNLSDSKFDFEDLIELFEFVISPSDKIVNGAVYTPKYIRDYIVKKAIDKSAVAVARLKIGDISCGCGGFLLTAAIEIHRLTKKKFADIFKENIFGIDITFYSVERARLLLALYALTNNEDIPHFKFNIHTGNSLIYNWRKRQQVISTNGGFDIVVGNPPYVTSRNMDEATLKQVKELTVSKTGHPDLYIPFFQIGYELLNNAGILGYITVNTFIKSVNGRALRKYFQDKLIDLELINFGGEQIFQDRNTYTCICFLRKGIGEVTYLRCQSSQLTHLPSRLVKYRYSDLDYFDGWNLVNTRNVDKFIRKVESIGKPFKEQYTTKNGIATLKNNVYKFSPVNEDKTYYYLSHEGDVFPIEKELCRDIVNANKLKTESDLRTKLEKIIFPYNVTDSVNIIPEKILKSKYPKAFVYLLKHKKALAKRDKGNRDYEAWYAFGRRQSMDLKQYKLFFPHICERPSFVLSHDKDLLFYNGIAVISDKLEDLKLLQKLMSTDLFFTYIRTTTKDYSSGYISMSKNYLKNFGIYQFSETEKKEFLASNDPNGYITRKYDIDIPDINF